MGVIAPAIWAANLTPRERSVCPTLRVCVDIIRRHNSTEFDYDVLEDQFRRFGSKGRAALFDSLESDASNPDIARMIALIGPLSSAERMRIRKNWTAEKSANFLPLLLDSHPDSRDLLLLTLDSEEPIVREAARRALIRLPKAAQNQPIPNSLRGPLLSAIARDPIAEACLLYTSPSPRDATLSRMPSSA